MQKLLESGYLLVIFLTKFVYSNVDSAYPYDYLCNNGTKFQCICYRKDDSLKAEHVYCNHFFGQDPLPVVRIVLNATDLTHKIKSTKGEESYEDYFKRRVVAKLLTNFCQNATNECLNTVLPLDSDNVVVLNVSCGSQRQSVINYVVVKNKKHRLLKSDNTLDPSKIISVINSTVASKNGKKILGHAKLVKHEKVYLVSNSFGKQPSTLNGGKKAPRDGEKNLGNGDVSGENDNGDSPEDTSDYFVRNMAFFVVIIILGIIVGIIYLIAIVKAISDRKKQIKRLKAKEKNDENLAPTNYGATNNGSQAIPFRKATIVSMDNDKKITSSSSNLNEVTRRKSQVTPSTSFTRIVVNHPPPKRRSRPSISTLFTSIKPKKTSSNENLIVKIDEFQLDSVKKSKTIHDICQDNETFTHFNEEFDQENDFNDNNRVEIRVETATSDEFLGDNDEQLPIKAVDLLTLSQTEENLLKSETSSVNEFSTESGDDEDSDMWAEQNLQPSANYKPLKESNWSINLFVKDEI